MYAGEMKLVFVRINGHQKPHPLACDGIVNADGSISHVWIEKQTHTHTYTLADDLKSESCHRRSEYWTVKKKLIPEEVNLQKNSSIISSLRQWDVYK